MAKQVQKIKQDNYAELRGILTQMGIPSETHEQIIAETGQAKSMDEFFGKNGLMAKFFGKRIEELLRAELTGHLGYTKSNQNLD